MADNVEVGSGSGIIVATDEGAGNVHVQLVKLALSADASLTPILADANGMEVQGAGTAGTPAGGVVSVQGVGSGTALPVSIDAGAVTSLALIDDTVFADEASFTLTTSKVNAVGGYAVAHGSAPDATAAGTVGVPIMNRHRIPFAIGGHPNVISANARITGSNTDAALLPGTIGGGTKIVITRLSVTVSNACTVNVGCRIGFGTANVPADNTTGVADVLVDSDGFPPGGGINVGDGSGIIGVGGDGAELRITNDAPTTGSLTVSYSYYTIES